MKYSELILKLQAVEQATGLYLSDTCVDVENAGLHATDEELFSVAAGAAGMRAEDAGFNINDLLGFIVY